jgi:hypothetical protein
MTSQVGSGHEVARYSILFYAGSITLKYFKIITLVPGLLRVLHKQLGHQEVVNVNTLRSKWRGICLELNYLDQLLKSG